MKILVLGASGMLGNAVMRVLAADRDHDVIGTVRSEHSKRLLPGIGADKLLSGIDALNNFELTSALKMVRPEVVVNCVGLIKQAPSVEKPLDALPLNALLPHQLAQLCGLAGARLVHFSTDCVFSGRTGGYTETDFPDARDLYGRSKLLGEVDYDNAITLRTSIIGHELSGSRSLVEWFLSQKDTAQGYSRAVFSGLPTVEIARVIRDFILPRSDLRGVWHLSADPIDKLSLLRLVADVYNKAIKIVPDGSVVIDRSLDSTRFRSATGYLPPSWPDLIEAMRDFG